MFQSANYISFTDLTPEGVFLWVSSSVYDVLGYSPEELAGQPSYSVIYPDDVAHGRVVHKENMMNDLVASQILLRYRAKDGRLIPCVLVFSLCYNFVVACSAVADPNAHTYTQLRTHSAMMRRLVGNRKEEFERIRRHHEAFAANSWNFKGLDPELRVCMLLNRFSRGLLVMYASPAAEIAIHMSPEQIIGKPILLFIRADDLGSFVEQMDMVKSSSAIMHMRFWFQSPNWPREIPCEAMLFGAVDGMVMGLRRCKPFVRKLLVSGTDQYEARGGIAGSSCSSNCSNPLSAAPYSSTSISPSAHPSGAKSLSPARDLPMTRLSRIGILDLEDFENTKMRPLTEVVVDDPNLVKSTSTLQGYGLWEYRTAECEIEEEDDSGSFGDDFDTEFAARQEDEDDVKADIH